MIDLATLKAHLQIQSSSYDALLEDYIDWARGAIEDYCEQSLSVRTITANVENYKVLPYNVVVVNFLRGKNQYAEDWVAIDAGDYALVTRGEHQFFEIRRFFQHYEAEMVVGFPSMPPVVTQVAYEICKELAQNDGILGGESTFRVSSVAKSKGGDAVTQSLRDLSAHHKRLLAPYKVVRI